MSVLTESEQQKIAAMIVVWPWLQSEKPFEGGWTPMQMALKDAYGVIDRLTSAPEAVAPKTAIGAAVANCPACGQHVEFKFDRPLVPEAVALKSTAAESADKPVVDREALADWFLTQAGHCRDRYEMADALIQSGCFRKALSVEEIKAILVQELSVEEAAQALRAAQEKK